MSFLFHISLMTSAQVLTEIHSSHTLSHFILTLSLHCRQTGFVPLSPNEAVKVEK